MIIGLRFATGPFDFPGFCSGLSNPKLSSITESHSFATSL